MSALRRTAAIVVLAAVVLGCDDDPRPPGSPGPTPDTSSSVPPVFDAPAATAASELLTPEEIGAGYVPVPYEPADPSVPAPCGGPSADSQWPPIAVVGAEADRQAASVQVVEEVRVYADEATAAAGFDAQVAQWACPTATLVGAVASVEVAVGAPVDASAAVGGPATRIDVTAAAFAGSLVVARSGSKVATVEVFAPAAPDPIPVTTKAVAKLNS